MAFCGGGVSDYLRHRDRPRTGDEATVGALLGHLAARRERWDGCDFEPLPTGSPLLRMAPDGLEARTEPRDVCPV